MPDSDAEFGGRERDRCAFALWELRSVAGGLRSRTTSGPLPNFQGTREGLVLADQPSTNEVNEVQDPYLHPGDQGFRRLHYAVATPDELPKETKR